ncbi:MAG: YncE family protein [bacterium]
MLIFSLLCLSKMCIPEKAMAASEGSYTLFESGQVRPLALSPDGKTLFAVNTPDNRLEVFKVTRNGLCRRGSVPVGLEPVAVAARTNDEIWVVNHLSDSVSIVNISRLGFMRVVCTLLVGDEPRDIVFAGPKRSRAFITCTHRGQNAPFDPQLTTPGIGRADVWVFDVNDLGSGLGGKPLSIINLFTDTPRALAVSPDGSRVYAAGFKTGNQTTTIAEEVVTANGGLPEPTTNYEGIEQPTTGLIVKFNGKHWVDELGREWDEFVKFSLPDKDVFVIDAMVDPPKQIPGEEGFYAGVGTVLFNMVVNPCNGNVYVANTDAQNENRFEGPGIFAGHSVRGHLAESRITILGNGKVKPSHLNKHIDYESCCDPIPNDENRKSLAFPMGMAVSRNGKTLYVTAFGSSKVGMFDTAKLEDDTFEPDESNQIDVSGGGPSGLVLDECRSRLYVLTRFDNSISIIDTRSNEEKAHISMYNPEPETIVRGRPFLYDASHTSSHGDSACASCHVFGDFDGLAWDLGDPDGDEINNPGPFAIVPSEVNYPEPYNMNFRPMKGPMTTQSLRGLANHGPMHWRGDRTGGNDAPSEQPDSGTFDEEAAFNKFNIAFLKLNGRHAELPEEEMQAFTDFALQITYPPNPIRNLDNSLTPIQQAGHDIFFNGPIVDTKFRCGGCHIVDPEANAEYGVKKPGFFSTKGLNLFIFLPQTFKIPNLRNVYQQIGKFGMPETNTFPAYFSESDNRFMGDQIRGFGVLHDGSVDTVFRFLNLVVFTPREPDTFWPGDPGNHPGLTIEYPEGLEMRRQLEQFIFAFPTNLAPIVGQQVTLTRKNQRQVASRIDLMIERAEVGECDLVAKRGQWSGYLYVGNGKFRDNLNGCLIKDKTLRTLARSCFGEVTYTCVPPGSGVRIGLDRDEDGCFDRRELLCGSDPTDPMSTCHMGKD